MKRPVLALALVLVMGLILFHMEGKAHMGHGMMGPCMMGGGMMGRGMGPGMMGWGYGMSWFAPIIQAVFWIAVIVGIVFLIRWLVLSTRASGNKAHLEDSALEILKKRYARGEINKEEFEEKKKDLA